MPQYSCNLAAITNTVARTFTGSDFHSGSSHQCWLHSRNMGVQSRVDVIELKARDAKTIDLKWRLEAQLNVPGLRFNIKPYTGSTIYTVWPADHFWFYELRHKSCAILMLWFMSQPYRQCMATVCNVCTDKSLLMIDRTCQNNGGSSIRNWLCGCADKR